MTFSIKLSILSTACIVCYCSVPRPLFIALFQMAEILSPIHSYWCLFLMLFLASLAMRKGNCKTFKSHHYQRTSCLGDVNIEKPLIFPGKLLHERLSPRVHSFVYSYLMVGVPIKLEKQENWLLSVDVPVWWKRGWLSVDARDHLQRGNDNRGLRYKLDLYLESQVILSDSLECRGNFLLRNSI